MRLLVCGGRTYGAAPGEAEHLRRQLEEIHSREPISHLIHGGARGADSLADQWARAFGVPVIEFPVTAGEWAEHGRAAGPMRNRRMLADGRPDAVLAFPGGAGTRDMRRQAADAGIQIIDG